MTSVHFDGIRIEGVKSLTFRKSAHNPAALVAGLRGFSVVLRGEVAPSFWRALVGEDGGPARRRRMRAAYGGRRGRGRW